MLDEAKLEPSSWWPITGCIILSVLWLVLQRRSGTTDWPIRSSKIQQATHSSEVGREAYDEGVANLS